MTAAQFLHIKKPLLHILLT